MNQKALTAMKNFITAIFILAVFVVRTTCAQEDSKPNIIYIMADEFGYYQPGFMGSKVVKTPNLDRMANGGMIFRNMLAGNAVSCQESSEQLQS